MDYEQLIKKTNSDNKENSIHEGTNSNSSDFLERFEGELDTDILLAFKNSGPEWEGRIESLDLFNFWKKIGGRVNSVISPEEDNLSNAFNNDIIFEYIVHSNGQYLQTDEVELDCESGLAKGVIINIEQNDNLDCLDFDPDLPEDHHTSVMTVNAPTTIVTQISSMNGPLSIVEMDAPPKSTSNEAINYTANALTPSCENTQTSTTSNDIPKSFHDVLFWPRKKTKKKLGLQRKHQEKIPAVLTTQKCIEYLKNKDEEKERLEMEKAKRKLNREMKKTEKQKKIEDNKRRKAEQKLEKQKKQEEVAQRKMKRKAEMMEKQEKQQGKKQAKFGIEK